MTTVFILATAWTLFGTLFGLWNGVSEIAVPAGIITVVLATVLGFLIF